MTDQTNDQHEMQTQNAENVSSSRRGFLKKSAALGAGGALLGAPHIGNAEKSNGVKLRIQSSWQPGTVGYKTFEKWAKSVQELTHGEVQIEPHPAGSIVGDFSLMDGVRDGVIEGQNMFTVYWAGKMPAGVFFSSYPMALSVPHHWDIMYGAYGGFGFIKDLYSKFGLEFLGHVHHDMNLIHSKEPLRSFDDFEGKKIRFPGGIVAETFASVGVQTTLLPGSEVYPALEKGTIDAADFVGPAVNYELGFHQVTDYIIMGPPSTPCLHQPVDLMDIAIQKRAWERLSQQTKDIMHDLVAAYSRQHYAAIQEANRQAWPKYEEAGVEVIHLSEEDAERFRQAAIPKWFKWANKDKDAARLFKKHLDTMRDPSIAVISDKDVADYSLDI